ncbi:MAG: hypothetical protein R2932_57420 [Caldilineaceae bacterium]
MTNTLIDQLFPARIGLGLAALGRQGISIWHGTDLKQQYTLAAMTAQAHAVLDAAWTGGVRYFDVARSYGKRRRIFAAGWKSVHFYPLWLASARSGDIPTPRIGK